MLSLNLIGITVLGIFILFILNKKTYRVADLLLVLLNVVCILYLGVHILLENQLNAGLYILHVLPNFLLSPLLLAYVGQVSGRYGHFKPLIQGFIIVLVLFFVFLIGDHFLWHRYDPEALLDLYLFPKPVYHLFFKGNTFLIVLAFLWVIRQLSTFEAELKNRFSELESVSLGFVINFLWGYLAVNGLSISGFLAYNFGLVDNLDSIYYFVMFLLVSGVIYLSFHGIQLYTVAAYRQGLSPSEPMGQTTQPIESTSGKKYEGSHLDEEQMNEIYTRLTKVMVVEKLYLKPKVTLKEVSDALALPPQYLSQSISVCSQANFYDLVNGYRVEHLKRLMADAELEHLTILALGLDSGFNSKASLNRVFKQVTGLTPSQYRSKL
ncbi:MAG: helix-turn-helix domain-containing protein [Bacteroidota bacterium]